LLIGGSSLNTAFAKENLIDEIILNIEPIIIGKGIPLFSIDDFDLPLELISTEKNNSGIVTIYYKVKK